jgi:hypothetical protein
MPVDRINYPVFEVASAARYATLLLESAEGDSHAILCDLSGFGSRQHVEHPLA